VMCIPMWKDYSVLTSQSMSGCAENHVSICEKWWESPKERDHWEDQGVGGKMGSEWILGRLAWGGCGLDSTVSGEGQVAGCCECGDEPSGSCATELVS
jgi:hypothetical protein